MQKLRIKLQEFLIEELKIEFAKFPPRNTIKYALPSGISGDIIRYRHRTKQNAFAVKLTGTTKKTRRKVRAYTFSFVIIGMFEFASSNLSEKEKGDLATREAVRKLYDILWSNIDNIFNHTVFGRIKKPALSGKIIIA